MLRSLLPMFLSTRMWHLWEERCEGIFRSWDIERKMPGPQAMTVCRSLLQIMTQQGIYQYTKIHKDFVYIMKNEVSRDGKPIKFPRLGCYHCMWHLRNKQPLGEYANICTLAGPSKWFQMDQSCQVWSVSTWNKLFTELSKLPSLTKHGKPKLFTLASHWPQEPSWQFFSHRWEQPRPRHDLKIWKMLHPQSHSFALQSWWVFQMCNAALRTGRSCLFMQSWLHRASGWEHLALWISNNICCANAFFQAGWSQIFTSIRTTSATWILQKLWAILLCQDLLTKPDAML